ncbi:hypothetical protein AcV5_005769 [Taiwanofungus camphoratus]|nr:hypothetical protein AcV5_005769 [Antrodia cinnamomea]
MSRPLRKLRQDSRGAEKDKKVWNDMTNVSEILALYPSLAVHASPKFGVVSLSLRQCRLLQGYSPQETGGISMVGQESRYLQNLDNGPYDAPRRHSSVMKNENSTLPPHQRSNTVPLGVAQNSAVILLSDENVPTISCVHSDGQGQRVTCPNSNYARLLRYVPLSTPPTNCRDTASGVTLVPYLRATTSMSSRRLASNIPALRSKIVLPPLPSFVATIPCGSAGPSSPSGTPTGSSAHSLSRQAIILGRGYRVEGGAPVTPIDQIIHTPSEPPEINRPSVAQTRILSSLYASCRSGALQGSLLASPSLPFTPPVNPTLHQFPTIEENSLHGLFLLASLPACVDPKLSRRPESSSDGSRLPMAESNITQMEDYSLSPLRTPLTLSCPPSRARPRPLRVPIPRRLSYNHTTGTTVLTPPTPRAADVYQGLASPAIIHSVHCSSNQSCPVKRTSARVHSFSGTVPVSLRSSVVRVDGSGYFGI